METRLIHNSVVPYLMHTSRPIQSSIQGTKSYGAVKVRKYYIREIQFLCKILELFFLPRLLIIRFSIFRIEISPNIVNNYFITV